MSGRTPEQIAAQAKKEDHVLKERRLARLAHRAVVDEKGPKVARMVNHGIRERLLAEAARRQEARLESLRQAGLSDEQAEAILGLP